MPCAKGMTGCHQSCLHREFVKGYRLERARQEIKHDADSLGYSTEAATLPPVITFKDWLVQNTGWSGKEAHHGTLEA